MNGVESLVWFGPMAVILVLASMVVVRWLDRVYFNSVEISDSGLMYRARGDEVFLPWSDIAAVTSEGNGGAAIRLVNARKTRRGIEVTLLPLQGFGPWRNGAMEKAFKRHAPTLLE